MDRTVSFSLLLTVGLWAAVLGGCNPSLRLWPGFAKTTPHESFAPTFSTIPAAPGAGFRKLNRDGPQMVGLAFDVIRIDFPRNRLRHSRKIWNHVDELRLPVELTARVLRNGLRVGAASPSSWPAMTAIFEAAEAQVRREQLVAQAGLPLSIRLSTLDGPESIFRYNRSGRLVGKTFTVGEKLLNLGYALHPRLGGCTDLELSFEIRHDRGVMTWERQDNILRQVPAVDREVFGDLTVQLTLNGDEFLVLGVGDQGGQEFLFGRRFLTIERAGMPFETMLCIAPRAFQTPQKEASK